MDIAVLTVVVVIHNQEINMNQNPNTLKVEYLLEDQTKMCIQFSATHATWIAHDKSSAIIGASTLLGKGFNAIHFNDHTTNTWQIQAIF